MKRGSPIDFVPKMRSAVFWAGVLVATVYLLVGGSCIAAFGINAGTSSKGNGLGNALYNFPVDNYVITLLCFGLVVVIMLDYAIIIFPAVNIVMKVTHCETYPYARQAINVLLAVLV